MRRLSLILALLLALVLTAAAVRAAGPEFPALSGRVVDEGGLLNERDEQELDRALAKFEQQSGDQIVVATLRSLQGLPIEDYGYQLGRHWGIGKEGKDNGALLIVAPEERAVRIEVGYGLEGELTDATSRTIIETDILPRFREGDFAAGIKAGVAAMIATLGGSYDPALPPARAREPAPSPWPMMIMLPIILIIVLNRLFDQRRRRGRRGYGGPLILPGGFAGGRGGDGGFSRGGGFGGGGFSGGGGSFGGGGASGRW